MAYRGSRFGEYVWLGLEPEDAAAPSADEAPAVGIVGPVNVNSGVVSAVYVGTSGDDAWVGTEDSDTADGNGGNDTLIGNGGGDNLSGGTGADYLDGGTGSDTLYGGARTGAWNAPYYGNPWTAPTLDTGTEQDTLLGGDGDDTIFAGYNDIVDGGTGFGDTLFLSLMGATSGVTLNFVSGSFSLGSGSVTGIESVAWLQGSNFNDDIEMGSSSTFITGSPMFGMGGNDRLIGGYFTRHIDGGDGNDYIDGRGGAYSTYVYGGAGDDTLYTSSSGNLYGGDGNDILYGGGVLLGEAGNDTINVQSSSYTSQVRGGTGDDVIILPTNSGWTNSIVIYGDEGNDTLIGGSGFDQLSGGSGNDNIDGGTQTDGFSNYIGDVAVVSGLHSDYLVTQTGGFVTVVDQRPGSPDGTDTLTGIEVLRFANASYTVAAILSGQASGVINFVGTLNADTYFGSEDDNTAVGNAGADNFYGMGGNDVLTGNAGADYLDGGTGADSLYSRDPTGPFSTPYYGQSWTAPTLDTESESDTLIGGAGDDTFSAGYGDTIDGGTGFDLLYLSLQGAGSGVIIDFSSNTLVIGGGTINNIEFVAWVQGSNFDDDITMNSNSHSVSAAIFGMGGNDWLKAGYYTGYMDGGDGNDLVDGRGSGYLQEVVGGAGDDTLYTNINSFASAFGGDGNDTIYAHGTIDGGSGNDTITVLQSFLIDRPVHGGFGDDTITVLQLGHAQIFGDDGDDTIYGSTSNDTLDGGNGADIIRGGGGINTLRGGAGNDRFVVTAADSGTVIEGGADNDTLEVSGAFTLGGSSSSIEIVELNGGTLMLTSSQFATSLSLNTSLAGTGSIVVTMQPGFAVNGSVYSVAPGSAVTLNVNGSSQNDTMTGVYGITNFLNGGLGADTLQGGIRADILDGGAGINTLSGGAGDDRLVVDASGSGTTVDGGTDSDTLAVSGAVSLGGLTAIEAIEFTTGAVLTLTGEQARTGLASNTALSGNGALIINMATTDLDLTLSQFTLALGATVSITINGSTADDAIKGVLQAANTINGGLGADQIRGGALADTINGGDGDDKIIGAGGADILTGGAGADVFRYQAVGNSGIGAAADRITDFVIGTDRLGFTLIDTDPVAPGDQAFSFIGSAVFGATGVAQMRFMDSGADLLVQADVNGDGIADMEIVLQGLAGQTLTSGDFLL